VAPDPPRGVGKWAAAAWLRPKPLDVVLAVLCVPATILGALHGGGGFGAIEIAVILVSAALVLLRHYAPIPVLAAGIGASIASVAVTDRPNVLIAVVVLLVFTVAVERDRRTGVYAGLAGIAGLLVVVGIQNAPDELPGPLLAAVAWPALAVAAGDLTRSRREAIATAEERARRAEETREEEARRRVAEERLHIARELHDVVAHRMAVVNVQAGVAEHLLRSRPDDAAAALRIVRSSAQAALDNLGSILNVLRSADESDASVEPAPMLTELTALIDSYRDAGLAVAYETSGAPRPLRDTTQLALYRTVQEALTNAHKYGDGHVRLRISHATDGVDVEVFNPVALPPVGDFAAQPDAAGEAGGFGLIGMRERVLAAGGSLHVGPDGEGGFVIRAHFPNAEEER
jgi:signal transduction histidine kinase